MFSSDRSQFFSSLPFLFKETKFAKSFLFFSKGGRVTCSAWKSRPGRPDQADLLSPPPCCDIFLYWDSDWIYSYIETEKCGWRHYFLARYTSYFIQYTYLPIIREHFDSRVLTNISSPERWSVINIIIFATVIKIKPHSLSDRSTRSVTHWAALDSNKHHCTTWWWCNMVPF